MKLKARSTKFSFNRDQGVRIFEGVYWLGFWGAIVIAFFLVTVHPEGRLIFFSVTHMVLLVFLAYFMLEASDKINAGLDIQTMGYLHTLIGFAAVFFRMRQATLGDFSFRPILEPLGSALFTSIIGWFFGGRLSKTRARADSKDAMNSEAESIVAELRSFAIKIRDAHKGYISTVNQIAEEISKTSNEYISLQQKQQEALRTVTETVKTFDDISGSAQKLAIQLSTVSEHMDNHLGNKFLEALSKIGEKGEKIDQDLTTVVQEFQKLEQTSKKVAEYIEQSPAFGEMLQEALGISETLNDSFQHISSSAEQLGSTLDKASGNVNTYLGDPFAETLAGIAAKGKSAEDELSKVIAKFADLVSIASEIGAKGEEVDQELTIVVQEFQKLEQTSKKVAEYIEQSPAFGEMLQEAFRISKTLNDNFQQISSSAEQLGSTLDKVSSNLNEYLGAPFAETLARIATKGKGAEDELSKVVTKFADLVSIASEIGAKGEEVDQELTIVVQEFQKLEQTSRKVAEYIEQSPAFGEMLQEALGISETLNDSFQQISSSAEQLGSTLDKVSGNVNTYLGDPFAETLAGIATKGKSAEDELSKVVTKFADLVSKAEDVERYLSQTRILITELRKLINFIAELKQ